MNLKLPRIDWHLSPFPVPFVRGKHKIFEIEIEHNVIDGVLVTELDIIFYTRRLYVTLEGKWFKARAFDPVKPLPQIQ